MKIDCTFIYFKPSGKYYCEGRGQFPNTSNTITHKTIWEWNDGKMPGLIGNGNEFVVVVIPDSDCESDYAYPRLIHAVN